MDKTGLTRDKPREMLFELGERQMPQLKCVYTNARSLVNKQEELEATVHLTNHDLVAITDPWWDHCHDWSAVMDGYKLFRRDRGGRKGGGVALYIKESFDVEELGLQNEVHVCKDRGKGL